MIKHLSNEINYKVSLIFQFHHRHRTRVFSPLYVNMVRTLTWLGIYNGARTVNAARTQVAVNISSGLKEYVVTNDLPVSISAYF